MNLWIYYYFPRTNLILLIIYDFYIMLKGCSLHKIWVQNFKYTWQSQNYMLKSELQAEITKPPNFSNWNQ